MPTPPLHTHTYTQTFLLECMAAGKHIWSTWKASKGVWEWDAEREREREIWVERTLSLSSLLEKEGWKRDERESVFLLLFPGAASLFVVLLLPYSPPGITDTIQNTHTHIQVHRNVHLNSNLTLSLFPQSCLWVTVEKWSDPGSVCGHLSNVVPSQPLQPYANSTSINPVTLLLIILVHISIKQSSALVLLCIGKYCTLHILAFTH